MITMICMTSIIQLHANSSNAIPSEIDTVFAFEDCSIDLINHLLYFRTPHKNLSGSEILNQFKSSNFGYWEEDKFKQFYNDDQYWFTFVVKNETPSNLNLVLALAGKGYTLTLYRYDGEQLHKIDSSSVHTPWNARTLKYRKLSFPFRMEEHSSKHVFIKMQKTMVRHAVFKLDLNSYNKNMLSELREHIVFFFFLGIFLIALIFHSFLYYVFKEKVYLYQSVYIFFSIIFTIYTFNLYGYFIDGKAFEVISSIPTPIIPYICIFAFIIVFIELAETSNYPAVHRLMHLTLYVCAITIFFSLTSYILFFIIPEKAFRIIDNILRLPTFLLFLVYSITLIGSIFFLWRKVNLEKKIFFSAFFLSYIFWLLDFLEYSGTTSISFISTSNMVVSQSIDIIIFLLMSVYKFWNDKNEKLALLETKVDLQEKLMLATVNAQESERKRIAQELHDGLGGFLSALRMMVNRNKNEQTSLRNETSVGILQDVEVKLDKAIKDVRDISHNLMPADFENRNFTEILKEHIEYLNENGNILFEYYIDEKSNIFNRTLLINLYRIAFELIRNTQKHSEATKCTLQLLVHEGYIQLMVEDNGKGFSEVNSTGIGLKNIRSRVEFHQGQITIDSGKLGSIFIIEFPIPHA
jgi:signal transduction histidine kinase